MSKRRHLTTEQSNPSSNRIDDLSVREILDMINREDRAVAQKVGDALLIVSES
jgi:N-acetylmuramic acid 6-phosphate (MurNAc-6-P) etherase